MTKGDVLGAVGGSQAAPARRRRSPRQRRRSAAAARRGRAGRATSLGDRPEQRVPMIAPARARGRAAAAVAGRRNAILTTFNEVNMAPVMEMRKRFQEKFEKEHGVKLGFMSFFVKAAVAALKQYPVINASVDGNDIVYHGYFDIGIAVGSPRGLVVPILRNADQMSFADIEKKIAEYGEQGARRQARLEDLTGGTFSITTAASSARCCRRRSSTRRSRRSSACTRPRTARWSRTARSWCGR